MNINTAPRTAHSWRLADSDTRTNTDGSVAHVASAKQNGVRIAREALDIVNPTSVLIPTGRLVKSLMTPPTNVFAQFFFWLFILPLAVGSGLMLLAALAFEAVEVVMLPALIAKDLVDMVVHLFASIGKPKEDAPPLDNKAENAPLDFKMPSSIQPFVALQNEIESAKPKTLSGLQAPKR